MVKRRIIQVRVTVNAPAPSVREVAEGRYEVRVDERAVAGKANRRLVEILAAHFGVRKSAITIVGGLRSREKRVELAEE